MVKQVTLTDILKYILTLIIKSGTKGIITKAYGHASSCILLDFAEFVMKTLSRPSNYR